MSSKVAFWRLTGYGLAPFSWSDVVNLMRNIGTPASGRASIVHAQWRTAAVAIATIALGFVVTAAAMAQSNFDRAGLLSLADEAVRENLTAADRHILVVRHARKADETCNALDCPLGENGLAMVARLDDLLGEPDFDAVYSTGACRTFETASAAGVVLQHAAVARAPQMCGGGIAERSRDDAIANAVNGDARWTFVAEHSNTSCGWVEAIAGAEALGGTLCESGQLTSADYGDIFWLYRLDGAWHVTELQEAFEVAD
jgi:Histidine phosphatase superfamily (branch 1)